MSIDLSTKQIILLILGIVILAIIIILGLKYSTEIKQLLTNLLNSGDALTPG